MGLEYVIYTSKARLPADDAARKAAVASIVASARRHNTPNGITGYLALVGDVFVQIVEGDPVVLNGILLRISFDPRHADMRIVARRPCAQRSFATWSMGACLHTLSLQKALAYAGLGHGVQLHEAKEQPLLKLIEGLSAIAMRDNTELVA